MVLGTLSASVGFAVGDAFQKLVPAFTEFRSGSGHDISVRLSAERFRVMQLTETSITAEEAKRIIPSGAGFEGLQVSEDGTWIERSVDRDVSLFEPVSSTGVPDSARKWKRRSWVELSTFNQADWTDFVEFAIGQGLCRIEQLRYDGQVMMYLSFAPRTPDRLEAGTSTLSLNPRFQSVMRLSPKFPPKPGSNGFVLLLHDPHGNVGGRFQTLAGLQALISQNSSTRFRFLVEGTYSGSSREIGLAGLDRMLPAGGPDNQVIVYRLLERFLINTPMAYRLLYDRTLSATAIDNNQLLSYPAPRHLRLHSQQIASVRELSKVVKETAVPTALANTKTNLQQALNLVYVYLTVDLSEASDVALEENQSTLAKLCTAISDLGKSYSASGINLPGAILQGFAADALAYSDQAAIYQNARGRNNTMAPQIIEAARSSSSRMPIAFIGNYHTRGIVAELQKASVGYVVVEPRPLVSQQPADNDAFEQANHTNTREAYLSHVTINMGYVAPTPTESRTIYAPLISEAARRLKAEREFQLFAGSAVDGVRLKLAATSNRDLFNSQLASGGEAPPPPGGGGTVFAYLEPGGPGNRSRLFVTDTSDQRWRDTDRYAFLSSAAFRIRDLPSDVDVDRSIAIYPDPDSGRIFCTFYDGKSHRMYCYEGKPREIASLVPFSMGDSKDELNAHTQVTRIFILWLGAKRG
jgi:hypothetical protein